MSTAFPIIPDPRYRIYTASSGQTVFSVPFPFLAAGELTVVKTTADGVVTALSRPSGYTVTGAGNPAGGSVLLKAGVPAGTKLLIAGSTSRTRSNSVVRSGKFSSAALDEDIDRLVLADQEHDRELARTIRVPYGAAAPTLAPGTPGTVPVWDADGNLRQGPQSAALEAIDSALAIDAGRALIYPAAPAAPVYDAGGRQIGNLANAEFPQQAVSKAQLDATFAAVDLSGIDALQSDLNALAGVVDRGWRTGDLKLSLFDDDQEGWLPVDNRTIGGESSGATSRANADTWPLFAKMWAKYSNTLCPIQNSAGAASTRGASAAADYAANKRLPLLAIGGEFLRFLDRGRGVDAGRVLGSAQADELKGHTHTATTASAGAHTHGVPAGSNVSDGGSFDASSGSVKYYNASQSAGAHTHTVTVNATGGAETRPRNIAFPLFVKL